MRVNGYEVHPLCLSIPEMMPDEKADLIDDIKRNGDKLRDKIVIHEGMILDGRHRAEALEQLNIPLGTCRQVSAVRS